MHVGKIDDGSGNHNITLVFQDIHDINVRRKVLGKIMVDRRKNIWRIVVL